MGINSEKKSLTWFYSSNERGAKPVPLMEKEAFEVGTETQ